MKKILLLFTLVVFTYAYMHAQCAPDRHNTTWFDGWLSCSTSANPNPARGESHWILYNFHYAYELKQMHIWNTNTPEYLTSGMKDIVIDISNDGVNWTEVGQFEVPMATGTATYEGVEGPDLEGMQAQYLLITGLSNYGGTCFGLSEVRVHITDVVIDIDEPVEAGCLSANVFPNPFNDNTKAVISSYCNNATIHYTIQDISGRVVKKGIIEPENNKAVLDLETAGLFAGSYVLTLRQLDQVKRLKMVKVE